MITEDYVNKEIALLLREKGFDEPTLYHYNGDNKEPNHTIDYDLIKNSEAKEFCSAPTLQMVLKWLREVHKIEIWVHYDIDKITWWGECNPMYEEDEENSNTFQSLLNFDYPSKTYEEACEAAIKHCLEHLI